MGFKEDLEFGNKYETELLQYLWFDKFEISQGYFKEYDIKCNWGDYEYTVEVKADRMTNRTGNICVEFECSGKPSGILTTTSNYYAYFEIINEKEYILYFLKTKILKKMIEKKKYHRIVFCDNFKNKAYLFNKNHFEKYIINLP
jgi:hypothetical protein